MKKARWLRFAIILVAYLRLWVCGQDLPISTSEVAPAVGMENPDMIERPEEDELEETRADWWTVPIIAHALGTVDGRRETNSLDAFLESYEEGQKVFEVDLQLTSDGHLVARHDWSQTSYYNLEQIFVDVMDHETFMNTPICFFYTPLDIEGLVSLLEEYPDIYLVTDSKEIDEDTVRAQFREMVRAVQATGNDALWEQIIVQIYHEEMYDWVSQEAPVTNWIFTLYQIQSPDYEEIGAFCQSHNIPVVTMSTKRISGSIAKTLHSYGCRVYVHTENRLRAMLELSWCVDGFYSDYVTPPEWQEVRTGTNRMVLREGLGSEV